MPVKNRRLVLLGNTLRQAREAAEVSQEVLSLESKVDRSYISEIENGHKSPSVEILFRLCPILGLSVSDLILRVERSLQSTRK